jgi:hypothetical protein
MIRMHRRRLVGSIALPVGLAVMATACAPGSALTPGDSRGRSESAGAVHSSAPTGSLGPTQRLLRLEDLPPGYSRIATPSGNAEATPCAKLKPSPIKSAHTSSVDVQYNGPVYGSAVAESLTIGPIADAKRYMLRLRTLTRECSTVSAVILGTPVKLTFKLLTIARTGDDSRAYSLEVSTSIQDQALTDFVVIREGGILIFLLVITPDGIDAAFVRSLAIRAAQRATGSG